MVRRALLVIDVQNDFLPGGALAVARGDEVVPVVRSLFAREGYALRIATQDLHPAGHGSFASQHPGHAPYDRGELAGLPQTLWPDHCVAGTRGAELAPGVAELPFDVLVPKGTDPAIDSYSGFFDNARRKETGLAAILRDAHVDALDVVGLATDYCVRATVLDALELGFAVRVVEAGVRAVDLTPGDGLAALEELRSRGAECVPELA